MSRTLGEIQRNSRNLIDRTKDTRRRNDLEHENRNTEKHSWRIPVRLEKLVESQGEIESQTQKNAPQSASTRDYANRSRSDVNGQREISRDAARTPILGLFPKSGKFQLYKNANDPMYLWQRKCNSYCVAISVLIEFHFDSFVKKSKMKLFHFEQLKSTATLRVSIITVDISLAYLGQLEVFAAHPVNRNEGSFSKGLKAVRLTTISSTSCYNPNPGIIYIELRVLLKIRNLSSVMQIINWSLRNFSVLNRSPSFRHYLCDARPNCKLTLEVCDIVNVMFTIVNLVLCRDRPQEAVSDRIKFLMASGFTKSQTILILGRILKEEKANSAQRIAAAISRVRLSAAQPQSPSIAPIEMFLSRIPLQED
ncbi:hypothetical protein EAG_12844 [Camponotus floridanus]|uniref:Uncharacterized protein n=1 Tax=Camponotus floridanus TaxID=104421 RepID=E2A2Z1_CAMFO|nr:hypothetical protein EAG_12844 [Camponotus floridanus]